MKIKICGLKYAENIVEADLLGPDLLGFIFHPPSPRCYEAFFIPPTRAKRVGVFVDAPAVNMISTAARFGLDVIQLHGNETPDDASRLQAEGLEVIKVFRVSAQLNQSLMQEYLSCCDAFLFDTAGPYAGGNGVSFDWHLLEPYTLDKPFWLSGGIGPADIDPIRALTYPAMMGIDLNSKFETHPGMKDIHILKPFINGIRK